MTEILTSNQPEKTNPRVLSINNHLFNLIITRTQGNCSKCQQKQEIRLISQKQIPIGSSPPCKERKYCETCSQQILTQLELGDYELNNKKQVIAELRAELNQPVKKLWKDYYTCKKPHCWTCWNQKIPDDIYQFCGDNCLIKHWITIQGKSSEVPKKMTPP